MNNMNFGMNPENAIKEFMKLWQVQFEKAMKEPDVAKSSIEAMQQMQQSYFDFVEQGIQNLGGPTNVKRNTTPSNFKLADAEFTRLNRRIEALEARIKQLELRSAG